MLINIGSEEMLVENNEFEQTPEDIAKNCGLIDEFIRTRAGEVIKSKIYGGTIVVTDD